MTQSELDAALKLEPVAGVTINDLANIFTGGCVRSVPAARKQIPQAPVASVLAAGKRHDGRTVAMVALVVSVPQRDEHLAEALCEELCGQMAAAARNWAANYGRGGEVIVTIDDTKADGT